MKTKSKIRGLFAVALSVCALISEGCPQLVPAPRHCRSSDGRYSVKGEKLDSAVAKFKEDPSLPPEGYRINVADDGIAVHHRDAAGKFYALMSLEQMAVATNGGFSIPFMEIEDYPAYGWRGVHIDESRHFFGKETLKQVLDLMAMHKLNVLHWHLTDDQGWRLDIPGYPELLKYGAVRPESPVHGKLLKRTSSGEEILPTNGQVYGPFYYTESDVREIVGYAAERYITVVPEIELPGHFAAVLASYPEFACKPENFADRSPRCIWGVERDVLCAGNDKALKFLEDVIEYVVKVFPAEFVHIGGDECPVDRWRECGKCQARIKKEGLKDVHGLQPWITRRVEKLLRKHGRRIVGWDEYLVGDVPANAVCMSWHTRKPRNDHDFTTALEAVKRGHDVVMAPHDQTYFYYRQGIPDDPFLYGGGEVSLKRAYDFNPAANIPEEYRKHILGGQCCNWSEYTWNEYDLGWKMWPRTSAISEAMWTGADKPGYEDFLKRMRVHRKRLVKRGVFCAPLPPYSKTSKPMAKVSLDGLWDFRFEKDKTIEDLDMPGFVADTKMTVPGCYNAMTKYFNQRGTGCYRTGFVLEKDVKDAFLSVDGMGLRAKFWIDGRPVGLSRLPWSKFELQTGPLKAGRHELVAAVDCVVDLAKVKLFRNFYDFYPFGGFHHGVSLILQHEDVELRKVVVRTRDYRTGQVELEVQYASNGPSEFQADVAFDGKRFAKVSFSGRRARVAVPDFKCWSHESPNLHSVEVRLNGSLATARFGIRQVSTENGRITLNGKPVYLKGVNRHESHYEFGSTTPVQLMYEDIMNLKELGGNFIRGSHYAQSEKFLDLCDELGVLVWEESLGWGNRGAQFMDSEFCDLQEEQTRLMVKNSINHPSVIISAFMNEPESWKPECKMLIDRLIDVIRAEDSGHLVTFACHVSLRDISHERTDIIAYNTYPCWYSHELQTGSAEEMRANIRKCHEEIVQYYRSRYRDDRPIIVSETGVKADYGIRDPRGKSQYSEDFQDEYTRIMLEEMFSMREIAGVAIWQFTDAKTYTRTSGLRNRSYGVNTGGLYDLYRRPKMAVESVRKIFTGKNEEE